MHEVVQHKFEYTLNQKIRLDVFLAQNLQISRQKVNKLLQDKAVLINNLPVTDKSFVPKTPCWVWVNLLQKAPSTQISRYDIKLDVIFEDEHLMVINKPQGLSVHPGIGREDGTLVNALAHYFYQNNTLKSALAPGSEHRPGLVHRLDMDTCGLMVIAKTQPAMDCLIKQFSEHSVKRVYEALVYGVPAMGFAKLEHKIATSRRDISKKIILPKTSLHGKIAILQYKTLHSYRLETHIKQQLEAQINQNLPTNPIISLLRLQLFTGRTHQIRAQMSFLGNSLVGDRVYYTPPKISKAYLDYLVGLQQKLNLYGQALYSCILGFVHPVGKQYMEFCLEQPPHFKNFLQHFTKN